MTGKKLLGEERREKLLDWLKSAHQPLTGTELAERASVSRQVIVGDITILKAKAEPIIATSQGYLFMNQPVNFNRFQRIIACKHGPERAEEELLLLVHYGVTVLDVKIEHSVYGDLTASIMVSSPKEVHDFIGKIQTTQSAYLSQLTEGIHLHTISASSENILDKAEEALRKKGFLVE